MEVKEHSTNYILLGMCCRITNNLIKLNLKNETGLFEWMRSVKFTDILTIISKIVNNENIEITSRHYLKDNQFLDNTDIHTTHYLKDDLEIIFKRRTERFLNQIKSNNKIIFIREDFTDYNTTEDNIAEFIKYIRLINPNCQFKILLLSPRNNYTHITHNLVYHHIYDESKYLDYIKQITF